jgi:hypothetical protein
MTVQESNACRSKYKLKIDNETTFKKKHCNKKFCYDCLQKNFPVYWENRGNKKWKCPCCQNECNCQQCKKLLKKNSIKETQEAFLNELSNSNSPEKQTGLNNIVINKSDIACPNRKTSFIDRTPHLLPRPKVFKFNLDKYNS